MKQIERFLNSGIYIAIVFLITLISWSFYQDMPPHLFNLYNIVGIFVLVVLMFLILVLFENTLYITPILIAFLFILNKSDMDYQTTTSVLWIYIALGLIILGPIIHLIRYKPKVKKGYFTLGLLLIAISYVISLIYLPFEIEALPVTLMGFLYLGFYLFLTSTVKGNLDYLFKIMVFANILLTAQVGIYLFRGYQLHPHLPFIERIFSGWERNLGWANINDMCFYIALTFPAYLYFIFKKQYHAYLWIIMIFPVLAVMLSGSRGGFIGFAVSFIGVLTFNGLKGQKKHLIQMSAFILFLTLIFIIFRGALVVWWGNSVSSAENGLNAFSTGRLEIYRQGLEIFKDYPLFGGGWLLLNHLNPGNRWFMYHSSIVQALAGMGIFGLLVLIFHYYQVFSFFLKKMTLEKTLFIIGYFATQVHGLIDNVQYAVPYSLIMVVVFAVWERSETETIFDIKNKHYLLNI